jgi:acyl-coenzyme A synthetase/AMP-(fatty) acid ligase
VALGVPDVALGHAIAVVVRPSASVNADPVELETALRQRLRADLPNFMQPRHIIIRTEMPRNPNGKLDRVTITAEAILALELAT